MEGVADLAGLEVAVVDEGLLAGLLWTGGEGVGCTLSYTGNDCQSTKVFEELYDAYHRAQRRFRPFLLTTGFRITVFISMVLL